MASYNQISKGNWQVVISLGNDPVTKKRIRVKKQGLKLKKRLKSLLMNTVLRLIMAFYYLNLKIYTLRILS